MTHHNRRDADTGETIQDRRAYLDAIVEVSGEVATTTTLSMAQAPPMDEHHPYYEDWQRWASERYS